MHEDNLDLTTISELLQRVKAGTYTPLDPESFGNADASEVAASLNQLDERQRSLAQDYDQNLERSEARLRSIIETTPVGICITNEDGRYEYVNPTYTRLYGYNQEELIGNHFTIVVPPEYRDELIRLHDEFMGRRYELRGEWSVLRKDGTAMSILADAAYIIDVDGRPKKVTFVLDISQRKEAEQTLRDTVEQLNQEIETREQLEQIKARVERMIRHDLRNPLNGIMAAAEIIMTDDIPDEQRDLCRIIHDSGKKLDAMLSNSVDLIRMEEGTYQLKPERIDIGRIVYEANRELSSTARTSGVRTVLEAQGAELSADNGLIMDGESIHLSELFANLIRNAVEASEQGDVVTVIIEEADDDYSISVHNPAVVPEEMREVFFHPYATSGKEHGTGLGTYVASLITRAHGGQISFDSAEGKGTTVRVVLPTTQKKTGQPG